MSEPSSALIARAGVSPKQYAALPPLARNRVARAVRLQANRLGLHRVRATKAPNAIAKRRAKNKVARQSRRANRTAE